MLPLIALSLLISCSNDYDGPKKILLPEGQTTEMLFAANSSEGCKCSARLTFTAHSSEQTCVKVEQLSDNDPDGYTDW